MHSQSLPQHFRAICDTFWRCYPIQVLFRLCGRPPISSQGRPDASHMVKSVFKGGTLCHVKGATLGHRWRPYAPKAPMVHDVDLAHIRQIGIHEDRGVFTGEHSVFLGAGPCALKAPSRCEGALCTKGTVDAFSAWHTKNKHRIGTWGRHSGHEGIVLAESASGLWNSSRFRKGFISRGALQHGQRHSSHICGYIFSHKASLLKTRVTFGRVSTKEAPFNTAQRRPFMYSKSWRAPFEV